MSKYAEDLRGMILLFCAQRKVAITEQQASDLAELLENITLNLKV